MSLVKRQAEFTKRVPLLINKAFELGFLVTLGDAYRDPRCSYGSQSSRHRQRLAIDLNLFTPEGAYLRKTQSHRELGLWWESIGGVWGGRFDDGNHYEAPQGDWVTTDQPGPLESDPVQNAASVCQCSPVGVPWGGVQ